MKGGNSLKRLVAFMTAFLTIFGLVFHAFCEEEPKAREVLYFYENYCESCSPEEDFKEYFRSLTGISIDECEYLAYNTVRSSGQKALKDACERYGLEKKRMPMVIVDGKAYYGAGEMENVLTADALLWGESTDSVIVLLTVPFCESCVRAVKELEKLPETVMLKRGNIEIESRVIVEKMDISKNSGLAAQLFDTYSVPEEERIAPCAFYADRYLSGADAIEERLLSEVLLGWAAGGVDILTSETENQE